MILKLLPHVVTVGVNVIGAQFTGPSLNPYLSFAWNYRYQQQSLDEHLKVFWGGPFSGAVAAGLIWRLVSPPAGGVTARATKPVVVVAERRSARDRVIGKTVAKAIAASKKQS